MRSMSDELPSKAATDGIEKKLDLVLKQQTNLFAFQIGILIISSASLLYSIMTFMKI